MKTFEILSDNKITTIQCHDTLDAITRCGNVSKIREVYPWANGTARFILGESEWMDFEEFKIAFFEYQHEM